MNNSDGLETDVRFVKGVGPQRAKLLENVGIKTVRQLINFFPIRYELFEPVKKLSNLIVGENVIIRAKIDDIRVTYGRWGRIIATITDKTGYATVRWFNSLFLTNKLKTGQVVELQGKVHFGNDGTIMTNPRIRVLSQDSEHTKTDEQTETAVYAIYPSIKGIFPKAVSSIISNALDAFGQYIEEWHNEQLLRKNNLIHIRQAYEWIHRPSNIGQSKQARLRFAYDELFFMQMGILLSQQQRQHVSEAPKLNWNKTIDARIRRRIPFTLTKAQDRVIKEIIADLNSNKPMCRLLQGDVGAGKTVVALYAALIAVANHKQVAIMAPTEILANQHYRKLSEYLKNSNVGIELLTSGTKASHRKKILESTAIGKTDILVGTHALIQQDVQFASLGLVIIDEQHKFGVSQRSAIQQKGICPHYLIMTATPIPRSLALTIFGDLEMSIIDELPPGRKPVKTKLYTQDQINDVWQFVKQKLSKGEQGFIVYPLLNPSDKLCLKSAKQQAEYLAKHIFDEFHVELIHGQMKSDEKQAIMQKFATKQCDLLVATIVIEVGIDIPDASVLVIEHAERFGLSQLHQLRGRVGRNGQEAYCLLVADIKNDLAKKRLSLFTRISNGFKIAEEDLKLRGPGEFFGTAQHGLPELKVANILEDYQLMLIARNDAMKILKRDPTLRAIANENLKKQLTLRLGEKFKFIDAA